MKICVVGTGYVGLVTGACFAEFGFSVTCVDQNIDKINLLKQGKIPIYEPGLAFLVEEGLASNRLNFTADLAEGTAEADIVMIAVGTPTNHLDGNADLSFVYQAAEQIAKCIKKYTVVVTKSTVPVGTNEEIANIIERTRGDLIRGINFDVASNPEFLREGSAINDFMRPDRVVVGTDSDRAKDLLQKLYRPLYLIETPIVYTDIATAELIKYASNGFLATKIAFINQIADICEKVGGNVQDVAKGIGLDNRIGRKFLHVSPGYGGSCFPKDTLALSQTAKNFGVPISIIDAVIKANNERKLMMVEKIFSALPDNVTSATKITVLGITFKPNTDDLRDASSLIIIPELIKQGVQISIYDPLFYHGSERLQHVPADFRDQVTWAKNIEHAIMDTDAVVILTEWNHFRALDWEKLKLIMRPNAVLIDLRNIYRTEEMKKIGLPYVSLGRKT